MVIPGFAKYDISEDGVVTDINHGKVVEPVLSHAKGNHYYMRVTLTDDKGRRRMHNIIRLLAITYLECPSGSAQAIAIDGDNRNTHLSNVMWRTRSDASSALWAAGQIHRKPRKNNCCTTETTNMLYDALCAFDEPVSMVDLSIQLQVPYSLVRYSMQYLILNGKAKKTTQGYEVIK